MVRKKGEEGEGVGKRDEGGEEGGAEEKVNDQLKKLF